MTSGDLAAMAAAGRRRLEAAGFDADRATRDAALLARWVLGWTTADWLARSAEPAPLHFPAQFESLIARRAACEPVAYLTREREFYGRTFKVTPDVLIPRPETEFVVEEALRALADLVPSAQSLVPVIVDVGTGSGCIAITLALEVPSARVIATDISPAALGVAAANARALGVEHRVEFRQGALLAGVDEPVDLLVSNPPYVAEADRASLARDVVEYEPALALFSGRDGLDAIGMLLSLTPSALAPNGALVMEIGAGQSGAVQDLAADNGLECRRIRQDLQGIPRVLIITPAAS